MQKPKDEYFNECKQALQDELESQAQSGEYDMDALFDCCGDLDPTELLDSIF